MTAPASPPLTLAEIAELRRLHKEATPGPFALRIAKGPVRSGIQDAMEQAGLSGHYIMTESSIGAFGEDVAFVPDAGRDLAAFMTARLFAAARNALPRLLLAAERAEGLARAAEAYLELYEPQNAKRFWDEAGVKRSEVVAALAAYRGSAVSPKSDEEGR